MNIKVLGGGCDSCEALLGLQKSSGEQGVSMQKWSTLPTWKKS